jgi:hypothetical protein
MKNLYNLLLDQVMENSKYNKVDAGNIGYKFQCRSSQSKRRKMERRVGKK